MKPLLDSIHALQTVTINIPVLLFLRRMEQPLLPPPPDKSKLTPGSLESNWYFACPHQNLLRSKMKCCGALILPCFQSPRGKRCHVRMSRCVETPLWSSGPNKDNFVAGVAG
jgi:hypothetical protein